jgi:zinc protease
MLDEISTYGYPDDYIIQQGLITKNTTVEDIKKLSDTYLNTNKMIFLIVGDAATQLKKLEGIGFGKPILLNE